VRRLALGVRLALHNFAAVAAVAVGATLAMAAAGGPPPPPPR
jgi:hypothetical protein